jgi:hypothetical protein
VRTRVAVPLSTLLACLLTLSAISAPGAALADEPKDKAQPTASLTVLHDNTRYTEPLALVTLYREGKPVRSAELKASPPTPRDDQGNKVTWQKLPVGLYELHFEAAGFKKFVKRIVLAEDGPELVVRVQLDLNTDRSLGTGASLQELSDQVARLKGQVEQLQAEVGRLKK